VELRGHLSHPAPGCWGGPKAMVCVAPAAYTYARVVGVVMVVVMVVVVVVDDVVVVQRERVRGIVAGH